MVNKSIHLLENHSHPEKRGDPSRIQFNVYRQIQQALDMRLKTEYVARSHQFTRELLSKIHLR